MDAKELKTLLDAAEQVVSADRASALDDSLINTLDQAVKAARAALPSDAAQAPLPVAWRYLTPTGWHATTDSSAATRVADHHEMQPLYAAPVSPPATAPSEAEEFAGLNDRLSVLLSGIANALKGTPEPNTAHSWHDLPELAAKLMCEVELHRAREAGELPELAAQPDERAALDDLEAFESWFATAYPISGDCGRIKYRESSVRELMISAWEAGQARATAPQATTLRSAAEENDSRFRRSFDLLIQNMTVDGDNKITWMAISCSGVVSSLSTDKGASRASAAAARTLEAKGYTYLDGAEMWKPPLGQPPAWVAHDTQAARDVLAERVRQVSVEGWTPMHDDQHADGDLALAASVYAASAGGVSWPDSDPYLWPWDREWWKPTTPRRDLVKAAALIIAEIERIDRAKSGNERADAQDGAQ